VNVGLDSALAAKVMREVSPTPPPSTVLPHRHRHHHHHRQQRPPQQQHQPSSNVWHSKQLLCRFSPELCGAVPIGFPQSDKVCSELSAPSFSFSYPFTAAATPTPTSSETVRAVACFNRGQRLAALGLWAQAIPHYEQALLFRPRYSAAAAQLGIALMHAGRLRDAVDRFRLALSISNRTPRPAGSATASTALNTEHNMRLAVAKLRAEEFVAAHKIARADDREALFRGSLRRAQALAATRDAAGDGGNRRKGRALFLEFGVFQGDSLRVILRELSGSGYTIDAFDSFDGLPEAWEIESPHPLASAPRGTFDLHHPAGVEDPGVEDRSALHALLLGQAVPEVEGVQLHVGLFNATLPLFLNTHQGDGGDGDGDDMRPFVAFAHIDCDLHSSTRYVLNALSALVVPGTVLQFDELIGWPGWQTRGEFRALQESALRFRWLETAGQAVSVQLF
jgi:hypothetical protein